MWYSYQVTLKLISPLHIGWKRSSNLQQTRMYVPAKNLWGAMIAQMASANGQYLKIKDDVNRQLRFSYFYVSDGKDLVWPWTNEDGFAWSYLNSYVSTALNQKAADRGFLHETEYIAPRTRDKQEVYLKGYVLVRKDATLPWEEALNHLQLGGERNSGWGRVQKIACEKGTDEFWFDYPVECSGEKPYITVEKEKPFLAHVLANSNQNYQGTLEPLIGRNTVSQDPGKGFGKDVKGLVCWMPGTTNPNASQKYMIGSEGIWEPETKE